MLLLSQLPNELFIRKKSYIDSECKVWLQKCLPAKGVLWNGDVASFQFQEISKTVYITT